MPNRNVSLELSIKIVTHHYGGIVVRILHHVRQVHDECIFVAMISFGEKTAWAHQARNTEQLDPL